MQAFRKPLAVTKVTNDKLFNFTRLSSFLCCTIFIMSAILTHSTGIGNGYGNQTLLDNPSLCTLQTCDLSMASFLYIPTLAGNALFLSIFAILLIVQVFLGVKHKTWGYMVAIFIGLLLEIIGYGGRIMLHNQPFNNDAFLVYLVTLTIGPALLSAAVRLSHFKRKVQR